jgi:hypothetical protein
MLAVPTEQLLFQVPVFRTSVIRVIVPQSLLVKTANMLLTAYKVVLALITSVKTQLVKFVQVTASAFRAQLARPQLGVAAYNMVLYVLLQISVYLVHVVLILMVPVY